MASELVDILRHLLTDAPMEGPVTGIDHWRGRHREVAGRFTTPVARAFAGGFAADCVGYAFASGYMEALHALVPMLGDAAAALCATESGGGHPRAIETRLHEVEEGYRVSGEKTYVTLGEHAEELLIVVSDGVDDHERNRLKVVRLPSKREGLRIVPLPPTPFVPEIPHAKLFLDNVLVSREELLPGDGYEEYLKPFRTVEDLHVEAAFLGYLLRLGRLHGWPTEHHEALTTLATSVYALALLEPNDAALHVALGGLQSQRNRLLEELDFDALPDGVRQRLDRDRPLLNIAAKVRARRLATAWTRLGHVPQS